MIRFLLTVVAGAALISPAQAKAQTAAIPPMNSVAVKAASLYSGAIAALTAAPPAGARLPAAIAAKPGDANVKLWIADPDAPDQGLATGIFYWSAALPARFAAASADGAVMLRLPAGSYTFDTVEPQRRPGGFNRRRYSLTVAADGASAIKGLAKKPEDHGFFVVTVDAAAAATPAAQQLRDRLTALANEPAGTFIANSACQLTDRVTPDRSLATDLSAGFPKVRTRLPSYGHIRALIVPVDFPDVPGIDDAPALFTPIADAVRNFYFTQSYGRLAFDFEVVRAYVRMPFLSTKYGLGGAVGAGDPDGYRKEIFDLLDPHIDFSRYDAVYLLVPKEMPMSKMGWGPAITAPVWTRTGYVTNGATGGADMYLAQNGGVAGASWKWMAHETGHAFGLYDEDLQHQTPSLGNWSMMANGWSNGAIELGGWDRYLQGWINERQVACLTKNQLRTAAATVKLSPLVRQNDGIKVAMVPLTDAKILVMESRRNEGYDRLSAAQEGVLVYTVDMKLGNLGGGYQTVRRPHSIDTLFTDAALRAGDTIVVDGIAVTVRQLSEAGAMLDIGLAR